MAENHAVRIPKNTVEWGPLEEGTYGSRSIWSVFLLFQGALILAVVVLAMNNAPYGGGVFGLILAAVALAVIVFISDAASPIEQMKLRCGTCGTLHARDRTRGYLASELDRSLRSLEW